MNHGFEIRVVFQLLITVHVSRQELVVAVLEIPDRSQLLSFRDELVKLFIELFLIVSLGMCLRCLRLRCVIQGLVASIRCSCIRASPLVTPLRTIPRAPAVVLAAMVSASDNPSKASFDLAAEKSSTSLLPIPACCYWQRHRFHCLSTC